MRIKTNISLNQEVVPNHKDQIRKIITHKIILRTQQKVMILKSIIIPISQLLPAITITIHINQWKRTTISRSHPNITKNRKLLKMLFNPPDLITAIITITQLQTKTRKSPTIQTMSTKSTKINRVIKIPNLKTDQHKIHQWMKNLAPLIFSYRRMNQTRRYWEKIHQR